MNRIGEFRLEIELGNDAMQTDDDIATALEAVATRLRAHQYTQSQDDVERGIVDVNGNTVGDWVLSWEDSQ